MMTFDGQTMADLEARSRDRSDALGAIVLALIVGILIGLILADALYESERPATTEVATGRPAVVAAPAVEGVDPSKLQGIAP